MTTDTRTDEELAADHESVDATTGLAIDETQPIPAVLDDEREYRQLDEDEEYDGVEASLVNLATGFRPYVLVVTNLAGDLTDEVVARGFDRDEAVAVLTAAIEALESAVVEG